MNTAIETPPIFYKIKLLEQVFRKARTHIFEDTNTAFYKALEHYLLEERKLKVSYKSLETYQKKILDQKEDYKIDPSILTELSRYLGYDNYHQFCQKTYPQIQEPTSPDDNEETEIPKPPKKNKTQNIVILLLLPICFGALLKSTSPKNEVQYKGATLGFLQGNTSKYMYWDSTKYSTVANGLKENSTIIKTDIHLLHHFEKITKPDTITEKSIGKIWYHKKNNQITFYTCAGNEPSTQKHLKPMSRYIWKTYVVK